tara:strand:- start:174 stop:2249 length:2076 start_codon:yes stop_codon:yes gene_type:complete
MRFGVKATAGSEEVGLTVHGTNDGPFVGVGTTNPTHTFHVKAQQDGDYVGRITNTEATAGANYGFKVDGGSNASDVTFEASSLAGTSYFQVQGDGKVGIGSASPTSPLTFNAAAVGVDGSAVTTMTKTIATTNIGVKLGFTGGSNTNNNIIGGLSMGNIGEEFVGMYAIDGGASASTHLALFAGTTAGTTEVMRLLSNGNVGIGKADPAYKLHVSGTTTDASLYVDGTIRGSFYGTDGKLCIDDGCKLIFGDSSSHIFRTAAGRMEFYMNGDMQFVGPGSTDVNIHIESSNRRVGIGTVTPEQKLDVDGYVQVQNSSDSSARLYLKGGRSYFLTSTNGSDFGLYDDNASAYRIYVKSDGNVGIGTNAPTEALDVVGFIRMGHATANSTQKIARQVIRAYNTSHSDFMALMGTANQTSNVISYGGGSSSQTCATELAFFTHTDVSTDTAGTKRARINLSGNFSLGADEYLKTHNTARAHIQAQGTSVDLSSSKIADATLLLGNEYGATNSSNPAYGLAIGVNTAGCSLLQSRRFNSSTFFEMSLNPYGGNVGIGTVDPGYALEVNGSIVGSSKSFLIDHPTQTGKKLMHACIEGPENGVYFRGKSQETGVEAPEYWSGLVDIDSMTVDVTPIGPNQSIYVDRIDDNGDICVGSNTAEPLNYFYVVYGERKDIDKLEIVKDPKPPPSGADVAQ